MSLRTSTTSQRASAMLQQTYAVALCHLFYILPLGHTGNSSSETVPGNERGAITKSFGNKSKYARSSETAKKCSATVSKNSVSGSVIAARSASDSVIAERSKDSVRGSVIAQRSASDSVGRKAAQRNNNWRWCVIARLEGVGRNRYFHWRFCVITVLCV